MPDASPFVVWLPLVGGLVALLSVMASLRRGKRRRLVSNLPTSKTTSVFIGLVELKGTAEAELAHEMATFYNTRLEVVPDRFVAALGGLRPQALMAANEFERAPVEVNLAFKAATT